MSANPDTEEGYDAENLVAGEHAAGEKMNEDKQHQEPFVPFPKSPSIRELGHHPLITTSGHG